MGLAKWDAPTGAYFAAIGPGMAAFRKVVAEVFGFTRTEVVRDASRCRSQRSEHCECGACDFFTTDLAPRGKGRRLFDKLVEVADRLGVQSVIFNRRVVGFGNPNERTYTGPSPHTDHVHVGLNRWARKNLTEAMVRAALTDEDKEAFLASAKVTQEEWDEVKNQMAEMWKDHGDYKIVDGKRVYVGVLEDVKTPGLGPLLNDIVARLTRIEAKLP